MSTGFSFFRPFLGNYTLFLRVLVPGWIASASASGWTFAAAVTCWPTSAVWIDRRVAAFLSDVALSHVFYLLGILHRVGWVDVNDCRALLGTVRCNRRCLYWHSAGLRCCLSGPFFYLEEKGLHERDEFFFMRILVYRCWKWCFFQEIKGSLDYKSKSKNGELFCGKNWNMLERSFFQGEKSTTLKFNLPKVRVKISSCLRYFFTIARIGCVFPQFANG